MEQQLHVALPRLVGAPAYARPPRTAVAETARPFDPDDLPITAHMTAEDRELLANDGSVPVAVTEPEPMAPRPFSLRGFADRLRRPRP